MSNIKVYHKPFAESWAYANILQDELGAMSRVLYSMLALVFLSTLAGFYRTHLLPPKAPAPPRAPEIVDGFKDL